ncbi:N-6 DNA methylase [Stenotrophomonas maltophilia]|uniref:N-6 DNA methylase n=1 Tax=Stenotrophomonas maltophilia TaxID=40324 RepID=UPI0021C5D39F|nr:N-6 DNA methylase [Stenotrophomonas maltophilia]MCU1082923.1 SAM-dependent DNA methyltransferase [Stenotrophomonas maltophilia]
MTLDDAIGTDIGDPSVAGEAERARRRALGAYYTPDHLSAVVAEWAIGSATDRVLEPGFGGCGFLMAAKNRLVHLGQNSPHDFIHGCDVDKAAFGYLREAFGTDSSAQHFPHVDFLDTRPGQTWEGARFNVALGNPPYVSYQALGENRARYQATINGSEWPGLSARASLWAYFVLHALNFLEPGGRVAWVLPGSILRANYAGHLKDVLRREFSAAALFHVHERLFTPAGVAEESVVLVAEGFRDPKGCFLDERSVETVADLADQLKSWGVVAPTALKATHAARPFKQVGEMDAVPTVELEKLLTARIGAVTGDNPYFLFSRQRAEEEGIDVGDLQPVFAKGGMAAGLSFGKPQLRLAAEAGLSFFLLSYSEDDRIPDAIKRYLDKYPKDRILGNSTFRKRRCWHQTNLAQVPHAFWPVMRDLGPKLVLNPQKIHCTNTVHKIFFADDVTATQRKQIAITLQCSYAQLHAEMTGRSYGSGVLKHEPRDVGKIRIPWPKAVASAHTAKVFALIDAALKRGDNRCAMDLADGYVRRYIGNRYSAALVSTLRRDLEALRRLRMPGSRRSVLV